MVRADVRSDWRAMPFAYDNLVERSRGLIPPAFTGRTPESPALSACRLSRAREAVDGPVPDRRAVDGRCRGLDQASIALRVLPRASTPAREQPEGTMNERLLVDPAEVGPS